MVKEETHGNIYPNIHILDILASWKSYKEVVVTNTHWKFRVDSKYFRGEKAIQSLGHLTKIKTAPLCDSTLNVCPGSNTAQECRVPLEAVGTTEFFVWTERDENSATSSFHTAGCWSGTPVSCAGSSWGAKHLEFTQILHKTATPIILWVPTLLPQAGNPVWHRDPDVPETHRHSKHTWQVPIGCSRALR